MGPRSVDESDSLAVANLVPSADRDKVLMRFYTIDRVLSSLGFSADRIAECLKALDGEASWEDALEWVRSSGRDHPLTLLDVAAL